MSTLPLTIQILLEDGIDPVPIEEALPPGTRARTQRLADVGPTALASGDSHDVLILRRWMRNESRHKERPHCQYPAGD